ncbi:lantibiotic dehydratase [Saccharothrix stipae]
MSAPTSATPSPGFRVVDAAMVRIAARPADRHLDTGPPPDDADPRVWRRWARHIVDDLDLMAAVELVSPSLADQLAKVVAGTPLRPARYRRLGEALARYRSRTTRATPLGLFAGVAPARFGLEHRLPDLSATRSVLRVGAEWLDAALAVLESSPELLRRVSVVFDSTAFLRDDRLVLPHARHSLRRPTAATSTVPAPPSAEPAADAEPAAEVTVRYTAPVRLVHRLAETPVSTAQLLDALGDRFPDTAPARSTALLSGLISTGFLLTDLRAPMTTTDPLGHLLERLATYQAHDVKPLAGLIDELRALHHLVRADTHQADAGRRPSVATVVADRMRQLMPVSRPLGIDLRFDGTLVLPDIVAREAAIAAGTLTRLAPSGSSRLRAYHRAFLERYGPGAVVPLTEVIDTERGLGWPAGYRDALDREPSTAAAPQDREAALLTLAWTAARDHATEVVLDEDTLTRLATDPAGPSAPPPAHLELGLRLHAADHRALAEGRFRLVVFTASRAAATMTGRFLDLLAPADRDRMTAAYRGLPTTDADALPVQLSCPPLYAGTHDIARSPTVQHHVLRLGEHPPPTHTDDADPHTVPLADLALHGDSHRLHLISLSRRRAVHPHLVNSVELTRRAHPLVRLLCELEAGQTALPGPFPWGAARHLPFLPRVRHGRTILSPARWTLTTADLPEPDEPFTRWAAAVDAWRERNHVPDTVLVGTGDQQLRLALADGHHRRLLRADLRRRGTLTLTEAPTTEELAWMKGRMHEIVVPLARDTPPVAAPRLRSTAITRREHAHLPGHGHWLYLKLYAHPDRHHAILRAHLPDLLESWPTPLHWWFLPYRDPDHHLRLRLAPATDATTDAADADWQTHATARIGRWSAELRRRGLISRLQLDTYLPEIGRFGDGALLTAAEAVFVADSAYVQHHTTAGPEREAAVAAGLIDLAVAFLGDTTTATRWMVDHLDHTTTSALPRTTLRRARELAGSSLGHPTSTSTPPTRHDDLVRDRRRHALTTYATLRRNAGLDTDAVLPALLHLHCVRSLGLDRDAERLTHRLARAVALGHHVRTGSTL